MNRKEVDKAIEDRTFDINIKFCPFPLDFDMTTSGNAKFKERDYTPEELEKIRGRFGIKCWYNFCEEVKTKLNQPDGKKIELVYRDVDVPLHGVIKIEYLNNGVVFDTVYRCIKGNINSYFYCEKETME